MSHKKDALNERVVFLPREALVSTGAIAHGFYADDGTVKDLFNRDGKFAARRELETDPERKQAIPYVVVHSERGVLVLSRKATQTEARLHGKVSIGVGGHIPDELADEDDVIRAGMLRELHEELHVIDASISVRYRGTLNDDSNDVGRVHLGMVFTVKVSADAVSVRETEKMDGRWMTLSELRKVGDRMETWSALLLPELESWI